jgi:hypothetical protein
MQRFWDKVEKIPFHECWEWTASKSGDGYGAFKIKGKQYSAHRVSYELNHGPIPKGKCVLHSCDNPLCVNPQHLWLGTHLDNSKDKIFKGRNVITYGEKVSHPGEKNPAAKLTEEIVKQIRNDYKHIKSYLLLGIKYNIGSSQIGRIIRNECW